MYDLDDPQQGIVHIIGPELGLTQPGMTIVCGDSHTATHGAFGALAFGIGTSEVEHVLATQTLLQSKPKTMELRVDGRLAPGVTAKDLILYLIGQITTDGGTGYCIEYTGSAIRALSMEERMTVCNMSIEAGARAGMIAPDDTTYDYLRGREFAPRDFDAAVARWRQLPTDPGAAYDRSLVFAAGDVSPQVTWGTNPGQVAPVTGRVPDPASLANDTDRKHAAGALDYMELRPGTADRRNPARSGVHRFLHQRPDRRSAGRGRGGSRLPRVRSRGRDGRARQRPGQNPGRARRAGPRLSRGRLRVARGRLQHVPGHESRQAVARRALRLDQQPQLRRPAGQGGPHPSGLARHGRRRRRRPATLSTFASGTTRIAVIPARTSRHRFSFMQPFTQHTGLVAAMDRANVDTDQIIPKQFLKRIERTGFGQFLFFDWRFHDDGTPNPAFELNRPEYAGASILLARRNFGCGSSREHAPWALDDYGFRRADRSQLRRHLL